MFKRNIKPKPVKRNCQFCKTDSMPYYRDLEVLKKYTTERGKILGLDRTGVCAKHQRAIASEVKRARHLAYLPFIVSV